MQRRSCFLIVLAAVMTAASSCRNMPPAHVRPVERVLLATGYCRCGECCGWRRTWWGRPVYAYGPNKGERKRVGITASGVGARPGTIAADTTRYPFGTVMYVPGYGYGRVEDRGARIKGEHIDLYFLSHRRAQEWGKQRLKVKVWFPPDERGTRH